VSTVGASSNSSTHGRLVEVQGSDTLIPLDQPTKLAEVIREFALASEAT
jgi:hypothetical protein